MGRYREIPGYPGPYFTTWAIVEWLPVFSRPDYFDAIVGSLKHCRAHKGLLLHAFVIMPTHAHLIASAPEGGKISDLMRDMKAFTSRRITDLLGSDRRQHFLQVFARHAGENEEYRVWQKGYQPKLLMGEKMALQKLSYVHGNPVRAGYVDQPEDWRYSSARNYLDRTDCVMDVDLLF